MTSDDPRATTPAVSNYNLCGAYEVIEGSGDKVDTTCDVPIVGRYVIVQLIETEQPSGKESLSLCEVEVFRG